MKIREYLFEQFNPKISKNSQGGLIFEALFNKNPPII
jgi:hypothetical protein